MCRADGLATMLRSMGMSEHYVEAVEEAFSGLAIEVREHLMGWGGRGSGYMNGLGPLYLGPNRFVSSVKAL